MTLNLQRKQSATTCFKNSNSTGQCLIKQLDPFPTYFVENSTNPLKRLPKGCIKVLLSTLDYSFEFSSESMFLPSFFCKTQPQDKVQRHRNKKAKRTHEARTVVSKPFLEAKSLATACDYFNQGFTKVTIK